MWDAIKVGSVIQEWVAVDQFCCCGVISHGKGNINGVITSPWPDTTCLHRWNPVITDARRETLPLETIPPPSLSISFYHWEPAQFLLCCTLPYTGGCYLVRVCSSVLGRWKATCSLLPKQSCLFFFWRTRDLNEREAGCRYCWHLGSSGGAC